MEPIMLDKMRVIIKDPTATEKHHFLMAIVNSDMLLVEKVYSAYVIGRTMESTDKETKKEQLKKINNLLDVLKELESNINKKGKKITGDHYGL